MDSPNKAETRYQEFVEKLKSSGSVFALAIDDKLATWGYEESPNQLALFWSEKYLAQACLEPHFLTYEVEEYGSNTFLKELLPKLAEQGYWIGVNWINQMTGVEISPQGLASDIDGAV